MIQYSSEKNATVQFRVSYGISSAVQIRDIVFMCFIRGKSACIVQRHLRLCALFDISYSTALPKWVYAPFGTVTVQFSVQFRDSMYSTAQRHVSRWVIGYSSTVQFRDSMF